MARIIRRPEFMAKLGCKTTKFYKTYVRHPAFPEPIEKPPESELGWLDADADGFVHAIATLAKESPSQRWTRIAPPPRVALGPTRGKRGRPKGSKDRTPRRLTARAGEPAGRVPMQAVDDRD
jgi:predicted DNA-binding transcriptional regulator AlpA